jgi:hypothetical protein
MTDYQKLAGTWNDGTIMGCSPIVTGEMMEPSRIVLRDFGHTYVVHTQVWPHSEREHRVVTPFYVEGHYYPKSELGALGRAWVRFSNRYSEMVGPVDRFVAHIGARPSDNAGPLNTLRGKNQLHTEITTLGQH